MAVYGLKRSPHRNSACSPWAIKKVIKTTRTNSEMKVRLLQEADILRQLNHPNIVGFRAVLKNVKGDDCLAMEKCDVSLGDLIEERTEGGIPFPVGNMIKVGIDISSALDYLHSEILLIHADIKSYNILVKGGFAVCKLCDFGVCLPVDKKGNLDKSRASPHAHYIGTPVWSAPEILKYPQNITTKADIYSFGLVFFEMIALSPPMNETESIIESETDDSCYIDDDSYEENEQPRQRPNLPNIALRDEYKVVVDIYQWCTEEDLKRRPSARKLKIEFEKHATAI